MGMVLCARSTLPLSLDPGQRPHKLCPTHSAKPKSFIQQKTGNPQRIRGLKGLPVIMPNGSNLARGVNELVSVLPFEPGDDHLAGRAIV